MGVVGHLPWGWVPPGKATVFKMASLERLKSRGLHCTSGAFSSLNLASDHPRQDSIALGSS